jgi:hypothetical protein
MALKQSAQHPYAIPNTSDKPENGEFLVRIIKSLFTLTFLIQAEIRSRN